METKELYNTAESKIAYEMARKKIGRLKRFYVHVLIYFFVNIFLFIPIVKTSHGDYFALRNFSVAFFWGIGLVGHGFSVLIPTLIFGKKWEDKKVAELMEKEKNNKWE